MIITPAQCVYVIHNPEWNITKIGVSIDVLKRKEALECACGCELVVSYYSNHINKADYFERLAHSKLSEYRRSKGEWFNISPDEAIKAVKEVIETADIDPLIEKYGQGVPITQIAKELGVTRQAILYRLRAYGVYDNKPTPKEVIKPPKKTISTPKPLQPTKQAPQQDKAVNGVTFLDDVIPPKEVTAGVMLKRIEANISIKDDWYVVTLYNSGVFSRAYTQDLNKAREYRDRCK
jgi:hypothetical protein